MVQYNRHSFYSTCWHLNICAMVHAGALTDVIDIAWEVWIGLLAHKLGVGGVHK
jgi:hypothetical protein